MNLRLKLAITEHTANTRETQYMIERKLNIPPTTISKLINGHRTGTVKDKKLIADYLNCKFEDLFEDEQQAVTG